MKQDLRYASILDRFFAFFFDGIFYGIFSFVVYATIYIIFRIYTGPDFDTTQSVANGPSVLGAILAIIIQSVVGWLYFALPEASEKSGTIGKRMMGVKVLNNDGSRISIIQSTIRYVIKSIEIAFTSLLFIVAFFSSKNQTLHDKFANSFVYYR